jgi:hypothetical protein
VSGDFYSYKAKLHTPASLADVLEKDYFPMPKGKSLYLTEYEWRMVVTALRQCGPNEPQATPGGIDQRDRFGMCAAPSSEWEAIAKREGAARHRAERKAAAYKEALRQISEYRQVLSVRLRKQIYVCAVCGDSPHQGSCFVGKLLKDEVQPPATQSEGSKT